MQKILLCILLSAASAFIPVVSKAQIAWTQVPSPNPNPIRNMVRSIGGTSSSDVWIAGSTQTSPLFANYTADVLLMRWNGSTWQSLSTPKPGVSWEDLWGLSMVSPALGWAVGSYNIPGGSANPFLLQWNGTTWTQQQVPVSNGISLEAVHAIAANDVWAVGYKGGNSAMAIHYNGSSWTEFNVPRVGTFRNFLLSVDGISANNVWAVGFWGNINGDFNPMAMHWDGTAWTNSPMPAHLATVKGDLLKVKMVSSNDVWAILAPLTGGMHIIHWDGTAWSEVPNQGGGGTFAVLDSNNIYAFGGEISHWNGSNWTLVDSLSQHAYPMLGSSVVFPDGDVWVAGQNADSTNYFSTLVYRSINSAPSFARGTSQTFNVPVNSTNNGIDTLLQTIQTDVRQILNYSVVQLPVHGTLTGFPGTAITSNGSAMPAGQRYTPAAGFTGTDSFVVQVKLGPLTAQTTIVVTVGSTLPALLSQFTVNERNGAALLSWSVLQEENTMMFEVEHSTDGSRYHNIGKVNAAGNSSLINHYSFTHEEPAKGVNYYRVVLRDRDGRGAYFPVKTIRIDGIRQQFAVSPNPVKGRQLYVTANGGEGVFTVSFSDLNGRKIFAKSLFIGNATLIELPAEVSSGVFILNIQGQNISSSQKVVVE